MGGRTEFVEHPYTPYPIQQQFMEALYQALEDSAVGLFESPTGTGKTISIICGALHWLEDFRQRAREADAAQASGGADDEDPDWLRAHQVNANTNIATEQHPWLKNRCLDATGSRRVIQLQNLGAVGAHRSWLTSGKGATGVEVVGAAARAAIDTVNSSGGVKAQRGDEDEQFLLAPTTTDGSGGAGDGGNSIEMRRARMRALLGDDGSSEEGASGEEADDLRAAIRALRAQPAAPIRKPQIFFASRTHSQLAQFVGELRRTGFASRLRLVSLASRRGLCINEPVVALGAAGLITERCTELQERRKGSRSSNKMRRIATCSDGNCNGGCGVASCADGGPVRPAPGPGSRGRASRGPGGGTGSGGGCPFLTPSLEAAEEFAGMILREPMDVEDLGRAGRRLGLCPYYGSRSLVSEADVVALPYSALLSQETCALLGLRLEGAVVIFDEAHNLVDAVTGTHGSQVTLEQLKIATRQLSAYFSRFQLRLSPTSARNVQLLMRLVSSLQRCLEQQLQVQVSEQRPNDTVVAAEGAGTSGACCSGGVEVLGTHDFLLATRMEHMNLFPLLSWVRESRLVMKVAGYDMATSGTETSIVPEATVGLHDDKGKEVAARGAQSATAGHEGRSGAASGGGPAVAGGGGFGARRSSLFAVISFLTSLTQPNADGRIVISRAASGGGSSSTDGGTVACLRYTVLNAAAHFASIVQSARSVILASGTLSPVEGLLAQLLPDVPPHRVRFFSCGHVVPPENLLTLVAACGPTGQNLDLRHCRRSDPHISEELGRLLINICTAVPAGVVVFAPSFAYLDQVGLYREAVREWDAVVALGPPLSRHRKGQCRCCTLGVLLLTLDEHCPGMWRFEFIRAYYETS
ncbi:hypothetical protein Vretifemale_5646 [Volvox reticuliferus]|uniref:Helicase ATP-binding domain-containing protein n=3 Tax=Volvox reticuliferus TaxID=1737510 RepID=A0A8J4C5K2_9CHLO|nr:hypothetical protein Vretifemale_5646 [Volvox reticuliferus]